MSVSIAISFPAGRFHATPWGHHVNEGMPEWPPSPWRLLRALVATWKRKLPGDAVVERELPAVLAELARQSPLFFLPRAMLGHTRHYMPWFKKGPEDKTLVFDAFISLPPNAEVAFQWPDASLSPAGAKALGCVLDQLGYFGRAESWAIARLASDSKLPPANCLPGSASAGYESVRVLGADPQKWQAWDFTDKKIPQPDPKWNLLAETADMHTEKWSDPPGSRWQSYARPANCFAPVPTPRRSPAGPSRTVTVARYAVDVSEGRRPLPLVTDTLPLAEAVRWSLMGIYQRRLHHAKYGTADKPYQERFFSPTLGGKDADGRPLHGHGHAFFLPTDEDGDGAIDHVTVVAGRGFTPDELRTLDRLRHVKLEASREASAPGVAPLQLLLIGLGTESDFRSPLFDASALWVSATPFLVSRYPKFRGQKRDRPEDYATPQQFAGHVLRQELDRLRGRRPDLPTFEVQWLPGVGGRQLRPIQFQRFRHKVGDDGGRRPAGLFRIRFAAPVHGPLCLGHSAHFGLGLFVPDHVGSA